MKKNIFERRIPTYFALFILLFGLSVTLLLVKNGVLFISRASPNQDPQGIQIVNVTDTSFSVAFKTLDPTVAGVSVDGNPPSLYFDSRDASSRKPFVSHLITVDKLTPQTSYAFSIVSNGKSYLNNDKKFEVRTFQSASSGTGNPVLSGKVILPDAASGIDTLVIASIENAQPVAVITNDNGEFFIPDTAIRDVSGENTTLSPGQQINLSLAHGNFVSKITYAYQDGGIIPLISLSSDYSFIAGIEETPTGTESSTLRLPTGITQNKIRITVPRNNDTFTDQRPQFQGTALPNSIVKITVQSPNAIQIQIRTDGQGNWSYRPSVTLAVGPHTITIEALDASGTLKTISSNFTVFASGSQVIQEATPSATPTVILPTATPTLIPTATPTATALTPTPTLTASTVTPTATPSATPTTAEPTATPTTISTPSPTMVAVVTPVKNKVPESGDLTHTIFLTTTSILFIVAGSALFFLL
ncbi:MAG: Ig-like domain-containing protein [Candidatus Levyibacteriota bacterium]